MRQAKIFDAIDHVPVGRYQNLGTCRYVDIQESTSASMLTCHEAEGAQQ